MSGIRGSGGNPPPGPTDVGQTRSTNDKSRADARTQDARGSQRDKEVDSFDRSARVNPQLETKLQELAGKTTAGRVQFSNEELAALAGIFAAIIKQNPKAGRRRRAALFTRAILKRKRFRKLFSGCPESELEDMCDVIAEQLDDSPRFAQLVEEVTEGARKRTLR